MNKLKLLFMLLICALSECLEAQSFFKDGDIYKFSVTEKGVYHLTQKDLKVIGVNTSAPKNIAVYGGDGRMLSQIVSNDFERAPKIVPHLLLDTGKYASNFVIAFYSEGAKQTSVSPEGSLFTVNNIYSDTLYYYLRVEKNPVAAINRIEFNPSLGTDNSVLVHQHIEKDEFNYLNSGRKWMSNKMSAGESSSNFSIFVKQPISPISISYSFNVASSQATTFLSFSEGDSLYLDNRISKVNSGYGVKMRAVTGVFDVMPGRVINDTLDLKVSFDLQGDVNAIAFADYFDYQYSSDFKSINQNQSFYHLSQKNSKCEDQTKSSQVIWAFNINNNSQQLHVKGANNCYSFTDDNLELVKVNLDELTLKPKFKQKISNFELINSNPENKMLVIYHPKFYSQVLEFQAYKNSIGIQTKIANVEQVIDNYGSGKRDISAIRNYIKDVYNFNPNLKYVLLFGACSYDYKDRISSNTNIIPSYESIESFHNVQTYSSDDFYGFMEEGEGEWEENNNGNHSLDLAIGRFTVTTTEQANKLIKKLKQYETFEKDLDWAHEIVFVADDKDDALHVTQANEVGEVVKNNAPFMHLNNVYLDAYTRNGSSIDLAKQEFINKINQGALFVNFTGHGSEYVWMEEQLLTIQDIKNFENVNKLPVFVTATCEFGRYDDPRISSGAEELLTADNGAIALVTTTRPVYSSSNFTINKAFYQEAFTKSDFEYKSLGEIFLNAKNNSLNSVFNRNFSLLGDPSLRLQLPNQTIKLDSVQHQSSDVFSDTLKPGETFWVKGHVQNTDGTKDASFNGWVQVNLYDANELKLTKGYLGQAVASYNASSSIIYSTKAKVVNGIFNLEVGLSNAIASSYGFSDLIFMATNEKNKSAIGSYNQLVIGGDAVEKNNLAPQIIYSIPGDNLNNIYSTNLTLKINLKDDYGILLNNSIIGKETKMFVNGDFENPIYLKDSLFLIDSSSKNVGANLRLENLRVGVNTVEIWTWDIDGLGTKRVIEINTGFALQINLYPNPIKDKLEIKIDQTLVGEEYNFKIQILDVLGKEVFTREELIRQEDFSHILTFNAEELNIISQGIYFYTIDMRLIERNSLYTVKGKITKL